MELEQSRYVDSSCGFYGTVSINGGFHVWLKLHEVCTGIEVSVGCETWMPGLVHSLFDSCLLSRGFLLWFRETNCTFALFFC